jgi:hypothetical protein
LEAQLHSWILEKNPKGHCVKDHYIQQKTLHLLKELHPEVQAGEEFKTSTGWLSYFFKIESALFLEDKPHFKNCQKTQIFVVDSFKNLIILLKKVFRLRALLIWIKYPDISKLSQHQK